MSPDSTPAFNKTKLQKVIRTQDKAIRVEIKQSSDYKYFNYLENGRYQRCFEEISELGQGGFGRVFKVKHRLDQNIYAIKKIRIHLPIDQDIKFGLQFTQ